MMNTDRGDIMGYEKYADGKFFKYENDRRGKSEMPSQHYHNVFEFYFLEEGICNYFIDDKSYEVLPGDIVLIPEGTIHKTMYEEGQHSRKLMTLSSHYIPSSVVEMMPSMLYLYRNPDIIPEIRKLLLRIESEYTQPDEYSEEIIESSVALLFFLLARNAKNRKTIQNGSVYATQAINYIKDNYSSEIKLSEIAKLISVSPEHLSRVFKKETGFGFSEYVTMLRLQKAGQLLKTEAKKSVAKIAFECGFNDSNYFSEKFKSFFGVSPIKYRKAQ